MPEIHKSNKTRQGIFISYARSDGKNFADDLRRRLIDEYHFPVWQDIVELEGGKDWWLQIEAAIKSVEYLVMVMTPGALGSQTTRKEWRLARQEGVCVLPVMAEEIDFTILPRWMRDSHFFDFKFPEQWDRFIRTLQTPCQAPRVPFMVEDKPDDFVERPEEFNQLLALLLDPKREEPIAITAALRGAGGRRHRHHEHHARFRDGTHEGDWHQKSLGAKRQSILIQFLIEAVVLCNVGGIFGVLAGFGLGNVVTFFTGFTASVPMEWAFGGLAFCTMVGLTFGM